MPAGDVDKETERAVAELQKKVRLPGFRPGKAPLSIVRAKFCERHPPGRAREAGAALLPGRRRERGSHGGAGQPERFRRAPPRAASDCGSRAEFEKSRPTFELEDYRDLVVNYAEPEVSHADVAARHEEIREQKAEYVNEEPRPPVHGDYALGFASKACPAWTEKISQDELMLKIGDEVATLAGVYRESVRRGSGRIARSSM